MPVALTFTALSQQVLQAYLERGGLATDTTFAAQIPLLINNAERAIARKLKILGMVIPVTATLAGNNSVYPKPNGWRRTVSMTYGVGVGQNTNTPLFARSYDYCRSYWPDATQTSPPLYYADYDYLHWLIAPTPDVDYPWEILYYGLPQLLDATNQTNFWTDYAPETLLYRALLECTPFLKNDERIPVWEARYQEAMANLEQEDVMRVVDRASVRNED